MGRFFASKSVIQMTDSNIANGTKGLGNMLTLNRRQLNRFMLTGRRCLVAVMLAGALPASIYAQNDNFYQAPPVPQALTPAPAEAIADAPAAAAVRVAQVLDNSGAPVNPNQPQPLAPRPAIENSNQNPGDTILRPGEPGGVEGLKGEVRVVVDPVTGDIALIGDPEDTAIVRKTIEEISRKTSKPGVDRVLLNNLLGEQIFETVQEIYDTYYADTLGAAIIKPLRSPNGLIVTGTPQAIDAVRAIVAKVDLDAPPKTVEDGPFMSFRLKHISAADAKRRLDVYFGQQSTGGGGGEAGDSIPPDPVITVADFRSNVLIVRGAKQYLEQAEKIIRSIDVDDDGGAADVVRVFGLRNTVAEEMAIVLQDIINGQLPNAGQGYNPNQNAQQQTAQQTQADEFSSSLRSAAARLKTFSADGSSVAGGIMFGVRVTADRNSNSLIVRGPESSMGFIGELVSQLDRLPNAEALIKVFAVENGDAQALLDTLQALFPDEQNQQQGGGNTGTTSSVNTPLQSASATSGASLINLRFSIDERTNSIIATGPAGDLQVVEDLIYRLDEAEADRRQTVVHRLSNSPVLDVQDALNSWIEARQERNGEDPRTSPGVNFSDRDVDVIPEVVSNSLIISATPEYLPEIMAVVRRLDRRPPMVKVKMLIAEVDLSSLEEFGVEVGVQDSLVFDRGLLPFASATAGDNPLFRETLAGQGLTSFGTGRVSSDNGVGGLVLAAGSESINVLVRALQSRNVLRVLSKPQLVTLENLQGTIAVGQRVPRITGSAQNQFNGGIVNEVEDVEVGVILSMTPRVSPDGMIVMAIDIEKSSLAIGGDGVVVAVSDGVAVEQFPINNTQAQSTIMARSGQTVVFSGLIQETKSNTVNGIPILSDIPVIGPLFKFERDTAQRTELMIIMTPYLVDGDEELEIQNQDEIDRMHWCLCDVAEIYGKTDYQTDYNGYRPEEGAVQTIYPDQGFQPVDTVSGQIYSEPNPVSTNQAYPGLPADQGQFEYGTPLGKASNHRPGLKANKATGIGTYAQDRPAGKGKALLRSWNPLSKKSNFPNRQTSHESAR